MTIELQSELGDGTFLITHNLPGLDREIPGITRQEFPRQTSLDELIAAHTETLDRLSRQERPVCFHTYDDAIESQHRQQDRINAHEQKFRGFLQPRERADFSDTT